MNGFYADPFVRQRLTEFLGAASLDRATAVYITHTDGCLFDRRELHPPQSLDWFLSHDLDIARSLADTRSYLLHLDLEYVNFDSPAEAFRNPWRCFEPQEPVVRTIEQLLLDWQIRPLHVVTGQGHHFVWRIHRHSATARRIRALCPAPELTSPCRARIPPPFAHLIPPADQSFFSALALVLDYVAHRIKAHAAPHCPLPVEITAVHVGPSPSGQREMVSIDLSEYGDPLHTRMIRMPFTLYRKPWTSGLHPHRHSPQIHTLPLHEIDVHHALRIRQSEPDVRELARRACVRIPRQEQGTSILLDQYLASPLRSLHENFHSVPEGCPDQWQQAYGPDSLDSLPPCAKHLLDFPNDLLLKPAGMQLLTRCLLAQHWHPRHIAGLIRHTFENPAHQWGVGWSDYEPATRAEFYTRTFTCLHQAGIDRLVDFNCTSTQEKGFCFRPHQTSCSLEPCRQQLLTEITP